jgi:hypothetical protein
MLASLCLISVSWICIGRPRKLTSILKPITQLEGFNFQNRTSDIVRFIMTNTNQIKLASTSSISKLTSCQVGFRLSILGCLLRDILHMFLIRPGMNVVVLVYFDLLYVPVMAFYVAGSKFFSL